MCMCGMCGVCACVCGVCACACVCVCMCVCVHMCYSKSSYMLGWPTPEELHLVSPLAGMKESAGPAGFGARPPEILGAM